MRKRELDMNARPPSVVKEELTMLSHTQRRTPEAELLQAARPACAYSLVGRWYRNFSITMGRDSRFPKAEGLA